MDIGQHESHITTVERSRFDHLRVEIFLFGIVKLLIGFDDEFVARGGIPMHVEIQVFCQPAVGHAIDIGGVGLPVGTANHRIGLHGEFLAPVDHIGVQYTIAVGAA